MPKGRHAIFSQVATGSASTISFNNIPQGYTDLEIEISSRDQVTGSGSYILATVNSNAGSVYDSTIIYQSITDFGTSVVGTRNTNSAWLGISRLACNSTGAYWTSNVWSNICLKFPRYSETIFKTFSVEVNAPNTTTNAYCNQWIGGVMRSNAPITSIQFPAPANYVAGATFTLYGIAR